MTQEQADAVARVRELIDKHLGSYIAFRERPVPRHEMVVREAAEAIVADLIPPEPAASADVVERAVYEAWGCCSNAQAAATYVRAALASAVENGR